VRTTTLLAATIAAAALMGCKKTGENEYEVDKPVVTTEKDTIRTPDVDIGTTEDTIVVKRPTVDVNTPSDSQ
jgi:hypothetical protein